MSRAPTPLRIRLSVALYRRLLRVAFPPSFLEGRSQEMVEMFRDRATGGGRPRGAPGLASLWVRTLADLARHGGAEWMGELTGPGPAPFSGLGSDVRQAARALVADRSFTAVAVATLALGVGANTAVFSVVDATLLRPLPYPEPDRLVAVSRWDGPSAARASFSYPDVADLATAQSTLEGLAPYSERWVTVQAGEVDLSLKATAAPPELFRVLRVAPASGRVYDEAPPERPGLFAVVSARVAASLPGLAPGAAVRIDGTTHTVTGVMPSGFDFPEGTGLWIPLERDSQRNSHGLAAVGRLAPGATAARAEGDLSRIVQALEERYPGRYVQNRARVEPLREYFTETARPILLLLLGTVAVVLVIACVNVTALTLVRAAARRDDLHVRVALGASRARIGRLALMESVLVAAAGAFVGLPVAAWAARALAALAPAGFLRDQPVRLDPRVLGFTLLVAAGAAVLAGLLPALCAARTASLAATASRSRVSHDRRTGLLRSGLVAGEVALAVMLLAGAGLLARTLVNLQRVPLGYEPGTVRAMPVAVRDPGGGEASNADVAIFVNRARERLLGVPGVTAAAAVFTPPTGGIIWRTRVHAEGAPVQPRPDRYLAQFNAATAGYFEAVGIPLVRGRALVDGDREGTMVGVVSETFARTLWPDQEALGRRFTNGEPDQDATWVTVVGVVGDVRNDGLTDEPVGEAYLPYGRGPFANVTFIVDGNWDLPGLTANVREAVRGAQDGVAVPAVVPLSQWVDRGGRTRFGALLVGIFAGLALLLATVGVYGLVGYAVARRRRELGLRVALGARPAGLVRIAVREGLGPATLGSVVGIALALAGGRAIEHLLYGIDATDPLTMASVALLLLCVAAAATAAPAARATRADPMAVLRSE